MGRGALQCVQNIKKASKKIRYAAGSRRPIPSAMAVLLTHFACGTLALLAPPKQQSSQHREWPTPARCLASAPSRHTACGHPALLSSSQANFVGVVTERPASPRCPASVLCWLVRHSQYRRSTIYLTNSAQPIQMNVVVSSCQMPCG